MSSRVIASLLALFFSGCCFPGATDCCDGPDRKVKSVSVRFSSFARDTTAQAVYARLTVIATTASTLDTLRPVRSEPDSRYLEIHGYFEGTDSVHLQVRYRDSLVFARGYATRDSVLHRIELSPGTGLAYREPRDLVALEGNDSLSITHVKTEPSCP